MSYFYFYLFVFFSHIINLFWFAYTVTSEITNTEKPQVETDNHPTSLHGNTIPTESYQDWLSKVKRFLFLDWKTYLLMIQKSIFFMYFRQRSHYKNSMTSAVTSPLNHRAVGHTLVLSSGALSLTYSWERTWVCSLWSCSHTQWTGLHTHTQIHVHTHTHTKHKPCPGLGVSSWTTWSSTSTMSSAQLLLQ